MNSISQTTQQMDAVSKKTSCFFHRYHVGQILRSANACKLKGFSAILVFLVLVSIIFENRSLYMQRRLHEESLPFGKDTAYRFLNSCHTNWRKFTLLLAARIINATIKPLTDASRRCAIVVDDSLFSRSRSKRVELLANVYDHVSHRYTKGFRLLVLGWTDGNTFLVCSSSAGRTGTPSCRSRSASFRPRRERTASTRQMHPSTRGATAGSSASSRRWKRRPSSSGCCRRSRPPAFLRSTSFSTHGSVRRPL